MIATIKILDIEFPNYYNAALPFFFILFVLEHTLGIILKKKDNFNIKDSFSSLVVTLILVIYEKVIPLTILKSMDSVFVIWIWKNYRVVDFPEDSKLLSFLCFILVDLGFYWIHRLSHEINFLWASHVPHHSSETYNYTTSLRLSLSQLYTTWMIYVPLGFFIPPKTYVFHSQWNIIYQFVLHTQFIGKLGPIEWIFNTPSHHRVHHGRNPKYLDKNYAAILIIWDRLFGTFQEEEEEVYFGIVQELGSSDPTWCQIHHWFEMYQRAKEYPNWSDKAKVFFYGPGWRPGLPRLGLYSEIPIPTKKDDKKLLGESLSYMMSTYLVLHFWIITILSLICLFKYEHALGSTKIILVIAYFYLSVTSFGSIFDKKKYAMSLELIRLVLFIAFTWEYEITLIQYIKYVYFISSVWIITKHFNLNK